MRKLLFVFPWLVRLVICQTADYPANVTNDAKMMVAANNVSTTLSVQQQSTDTVVVVASTTGFQPNMLISICAPNTSIFGATGTCAAGAAIEIEVVCSVLGANTMTIGYAGSCPSTGGRGFDNTVAALHQPGALVAVNMDAWHRNKDRVEIEAIQTTLGPNLSNVPRAIPVSSTTYNFTAISPGGSLTGGGGNQTIPISVCPPGLVLSGTSATAVYLSGGTGTAEWQRLTGGNCPAGSSGNIILAPANSHSGAWTITSATAGIDLACSSSAGATVQIPPGAYNIYGTIRPAAGCTIDGLGFASQNGPTAAAKLTLETNGIPLFDIVNYGTTIRNLYLQGPTSPTSGSVGIQSGVTNSIDEPFVENVIINAFYVGQVAMNGRIYDHNVQSQANVTDGFQIGGTSLGDALGSGTMEYVFSQNNSGNGFTLKYQAALQWHNVNCFDNGGWGIQSTVANSWQMDNVDCEQDYSGEMQVAGAASAVQTLQNFVFQSAGATVLFGTNTSSPALQIANVNNEGLVVSNGSISGAQGNAMELAGQGGLFSNIIAFSNGIGAVAGHRYCLDVASTGSTQTLTGIACYTSTYGIGSIVFGSINTITGSTFSAVNNSLPAMTFGSGAERNIFCDNFVLNSGSGGSITWSGSNTVGECYNSVEGAVSGTPTQDTIFPSYQTIPLTPLPTPTALTITSNTIAPALPLHTIGAGTVATITPPTSGASYCFDLIATAATVFNTAGNIISTGFTATSGQVYRACYNSASTQWSIK